MTEEQAQLLLYAIQNMTSNSYTTAMCLQKIAEDLAHQVAIMSTIRNSLDTLVGFIDDKTR